MFASSMSGNCYKLQTNKQKTFVNKLIEEDGRETVICETLTRSSTPPFTLMGIPGCHLNPVQAIEWAMWNISHPQLHHLFRRHRSLTQHHFKEMPIAKSCLCVNVVPLGARTNARSLAGIAFRQTLHFSHEQETPGISLYRINGNSAFLENFFEWIVSLRTNDVISFSVFSRPLCSLSLIKWDCIFKLYEHT